MHQLPPFFKVFLLCLSLYILNVLWLRNYTYFQDFFDPWECAGYGELTYFQLWVIISSVPIHIIAIIFWLENRYPGVSTTHFFGSCLVVQCHYICYSDISSYYFIHVDLVGTDKVFIVKRMVIMAAIIILSNVGMVLLELKDILRSSDKMVDDKKDK